MELYCWRAMSRVAGKDRTQRFSNTENFKQRKTFECSSATLHLTIFSMRKSGTNHCVVQDRKHFSNWSYLCLFCPAKKLNTSAGTIRTVLSHEDNEAFILGTQKLHLLDISRVTGFKTFDEYRWVDYAQSSERPAALSVEEPRVSLTLSDIRERHSADQSKIREFHGAPFMNALHQATHVSVQTLYRSSS